MADEHPDAPSGVAFRRTSDLREARAGRRSFVSYLRERVGRRLRAVLEDGPDRTTVAFCRADFDLDPRDGHLLDGVRTNHRCTVAVRAAMVWLSFDCSDRRVLVAVESEPSRDLAALVADCRSALAAGDGERSDEAGSRKL
jgi:hypothetical protein